MRFAFDDAFDDLRRFRFRCGMWTVDCVFVRFVHFEPAVESEAMGIHETEVVKDCCSELEVALESKGGTRDG
ncbi:hypothetical protein M758_UG112100 [Ceratodon purpureus]|nr:hypothetical protein M758_UG112100 [Ceratodon purpureus]